jgi:hypothetical protein
MKRLIVIIGLGLLVNISFAQQTIAKDSTLNPVKAEQDSTVKAAEKPYVIVDKPFHKEPVMQLGDLKYKRRSFTLGQELLGVALLGVEAYKNEINRQKDLKKGLKNYRTEE